MLPFGTRRILALGLGGMVALLHGAGLATRAEASSGVAQCAGLDAQTQASHVFDWPGVSPGKRVTRVQYVGKAPIHRTAGVELTVPAGPGISSGYLHRLVSCHVARVAQERTAEGRAVAAIDTQVVPHGAVYRLRLTSADVATAQELVRRFAP